MNVFDFITESEIENLPEDSRAAFVEFVRVAQRRLDERNQSYSDGEQTWRLIQDNQYSFMNVVIGAAKRLAVSPFSEMSVPTIDRYKGEAYDQFIADLDHFVTQIVIDRGIVGRRDTVQLADDTRGRIRSHIHHLREEVKKSTLDGAKKSALTAKLDEFEKALEKNRVSLLAVARVAFEIMAVPGAMWGSYDATTRLISNIMQTVGEAKAVEDENRRLPPEPKPFALLPPRSPESERPSTSRFDNSGLDDEIPF